MPPEETDMASDLKQLIKQRDDARAAVEKIDEAIKKYESREAWEQRDIARTEYEHRYLQTVHLGTDFWQGVAALAEPAGEAWLFTADVMQHDRELATKYTEQPAQS